MFRRFMEGRYGWDQLNFFLAVTVLALGLLAKIPILYFLFYIELIPMGIIFFRTLSRNTGRRYQENMLFMSLWGRIKMWFQRVKAPPRANSAGSRTHKLYVCPHCAKTLRVPRGKGKIMITCPVCHERFSTTT